MKLNWYVHSTMQIGNCPPVPEYRCDLGTGSDGHEWICSSKYREQERKFLVSFDYETEEQSAFLKSEVVDADNYWEAHRKVYHSKLCNYEKIQDVVKSFSDQMGIQL